MDSIKTWAVETFGPSAIRGVILGAFGVLVTHSQMLSKFGIITDSVAHTTTIHWTTASDVLVPIVIAIVAGFIKTGHVTLTNVIQAPKGDNQ